MDKESFKEFGHYLRQKRVEKGFSQTDVGQHLGYSSQFVANWERGASTPPMQALRKLVSLYGIPQKDILLFLEKVQTSFWKRNLFGGKKQRLN